MWKNVHGYLAHSSTLEKCAIMCRNIFFKKSSLKMFNKSMLNYLHNVEISLQGKKIMF